MFCSKCGAKIEAGVKFCSSCGQAATASGGGSTPVQSDVINYIDTNIRLYIAIALNIAVAVMFVLRWFDMGGLSLAGSLTGLPIDGTDGVTISGAFSAINQAVEPARASGAPMGGFVILQIFLIALLVIPAINILSAFLLFVKKQRARSVLFVSGVYTLAVSALFIIFVFIYNAYLSNDTSGLASMLIGVSLKAPAYVTAILGLASIFAVPKSSTVVSTISSAIIEEDIEQKMEKRRRSEKESGLMVILPFLAFLPTIIAQWMYQFIDLQFIARGLGENGFGGLATATGFMRGLIFLSAILGVTAFIIGNRHKDNPKQKNAIFLKLSAVFAIIVTILAFALKSGYAVLAGTPPQFIAPYNGYVSIACFGILTVFAYNALSIINIEKGNIKNPFIFIMVGIILNIALDWLFILIVSMGVAGAAIATVAAQLASVALYAVFTFSRKSKAH